MAWRTRLSRSGGVVLKRLITYESDEPPVRLTTSSLGLFWTIGSDSMGIALATCAVPAASSNTRVDGSGTCRNVSFSGNGLPPR